jgi:hypothetical protein
VRRGFAPSFICLTLRKSMARRVLRFDRSAGVPQKRCKTVEFCISPTQESAPVIRRTRCARAQNSKSLLPFRRASAGELTCSSNQICKERAPLDRLRRAFDQVRGGCIVQRGTTIAHRKWFAHNFSWPPLCRSTSRNTYHNRHCSAVASERRNRGEPIYVLG